MTFNEFLIAHVQRQWNVEDSLFPSGINGLYNDPETPIRNNSHYLVILSYLHNEGWEKSEYYVKIILNYLIDNHFDESNYIFRKKEGKDYSNGLIGIAWLIEGVCSAYNSGFDCRILINRINNIIKGYAFDDSLGVWTNRVEPNNITIGIDRTLNHQIWFTAMVAKLNHIIEDNTLKKYIELFIERLPQNTKLNKDSLYYHTINYKLEYYKTRVKRLIQKKYREEMKVKEAGYHMFNLIGLYLLQAETKKDILGNSINSRAIDQINKVQFRDLLNNNPYAFPYNPVGIELSIIKSNRQLKYSLKEILNDLNLQFLLWNRQENEFLSEDKATLNARLYEMTYLDKDFLNSIRFDDKHGIWKLKTGE